MTIAPPGGPEGSRPLPGVLQKRGAKQNPEACDPGRGLHEGEHPWSSSSREKEATWFLVSPLSQRPFLPSRSLPVPSYPIFSQDDQQSVIPREEAE